MRESFWRFAGGPLLLVLGVTLAGCPPPRPASSDSATEPAPQPGKELYPAIEKKDIDPAGKLEVFTTSVLTDGRFLKIRGKLRNPMGAPVDGVRVMFRVYNSTAGGRPLQTVQEENSIHLDAGATTALRLDIETMYAGNGAFRVDAYAERVGDRDIPPPPGWRE